MSTLTISANKLAPLILPAIKEFTVAFTFIGLVTLIYVLATGEHPTVCVGPIHDIPLIISGLIILARAAKKNANTTAQHIPYKKQIMSLFTTLKYCVTALWLAYYTASEFGLLILN